MEDIGIDSLGFYEILIEADTCFGIRIQEEQLLQFKTVGDIQTIWNRWTSMPSAPEPPEPVQQRHCRGRLAGAPSRPSAMTQQHLVSRLRWRSGIKALTSEWADDLNVRIAGRVAETAFAGWNLCSARGAPTAAPSWPCWPLGRPGPWPQRPSARS